MDDLEMIAAVEAECFPAAEAASIKEKNAILRLTDFGRLGGKIWKIIYDINSSPQMKARIIMPGKYILKLLQN